MYGSWQEFINDFKCMVYPDSRQLSGLRLSITDQEIEAFWESRTLQEMEQLFTISNSYIQSFMLSQLLQPYLSSRRIIYQAYVVGRVDDKNQQQSVMYVYDCRLFRGSLYAKQQNDFISSFMLLYREQVQMEQNIFEVVDANELAANCWMLKVKESSLLRVFGYIKENMKRLRHKNDRIVLEEEKYGDFMEHWLKYYYSYKIDITVGFFFKGIMALLENQVLSGYFQTLTPQQRYERMYRRPIRSIDKPKNVEQFTLTEGIAQTETKWQSLKITAFRLKYLVEDVNEKYECYRVEQSEQGGLDLSELSQQDRLILYAFSTVRSEEEEYSSSFYV